MDNLCAGDGYVYILSPDMAEHALHFRFYTSLGNGSDLCRVCSLIIKTTRVLPSALIQTIIPPSLIFLSAIICQDIVLPATLKV